MFLIGIVVSQFYIILYQDIILLSILIFKNIFGCSFKILSGIGKGKISYNTSYESGRRITMCGRYYVDEESNEELLRIIRNLDRRLQGELLQEPDPNNNGTHVPRKFKTGEIYPTNIAPIITKKEKDIIPSAMVWGYKSFQGSKVIINARSESATEKRMFMSDLENRRIVIPASGFYEWAHTGSKTKYYFTSQQQKPLYMAGLSHSYEEEDRFVILTTAANDSMKDIHNRMPVLLKEDEIEGWLSSREEALFIMKRIPEQLQKVKDSPKEEPEFEQLKFPW